MYEYPEYKITNKSSPQFILGTMEDLRTLFLNQCNNLSFILALNPDENPSNLVLCPMLESLVIYVKDKLSFRLSALVTMARERASKGVVLQSVTLISQDELEPEEVSSLKECVPCVDHSFGMGPPKWDTISADERE